MSYYEHHLSIDKNRKHVAIYIDTKELARFKQNTVQCIVNVTLCHKSTDNDYKKDCKNISIVAVSKLSDEFRELGRVHITDTATDIIIM